MRKNKGFTLIEMMIVILVIAVLALIVGLAVRNAGQRAKSARKMEDVRSINDAATIYENDTGEVAGTVAVLRAEAGPDGYNGPYLSGGNEPTDPFGGGAYALTDGKVSGPADITTFQN
jgi:general secretion pathway protein G